MARVQANGVNFHYLQVGAGPDLVMLHGLLGNQAVWHLGMIPMLRHAFRVTTYDLRGHGKTEMPAAGYSTGDMAEDLKALLDALNIQRACLVGHSFGADIALHFALRYPERAERLVLVEAGIPALLNQRKHLDWEGWSYWAEMIEHFAGIRIPREKWNDITFMVRQSLEVPIIYGPASGLPRKKDNVLRLLESTTLFHDYEVVADLCMENLPTVPHRKLLIYDASSPYIGSYDTLRGVLTNCEHVLLPPSKYRHFGPLEHGSVLADYILRFLDARPPDARVLEARPALNDRRSPASV